MEKANRVKNFFGRIGRRNLIILSVMLLIGLAVYLNYLWFYHPTDQIGYGDQNTAGTGDGTVDTGAGATDYFAAAILARKTTRNESLEVLNNLVQTAEGEKKEEALAQISQIAQDMEREANIETLIKAKGYAQCVAVINGKTASIIVSGENQLDPARVAAISAIVYEQAGIVPADLTVAQK